MNLIALRTRAFYYDVCVGSLMFIYYTHVRIFQVTFLYKHSFNSPVTKESLRIKKLGGTFHCCDETTLKQLVKLTFSQEDVYSTMF